MPLYTIPIVNTTSDNPTLISSTVSLVNGEYWAFDVVEQSSQNQYTDPGALINPDPNGNLSTQTNISGSIVNMNNINVYVLVYNDPTYVTITNNSGQTATKAYREVRVVAPSSSSIGDPMITPMLV